MAKAASIILLVVTIILVACAPTSPPVPPPSQKIVPTPTPTSSPTPTIRPSPTPSPTETATPVPPTPTPLPQNAPPVIETPILPSQLYVGRSISIELNVFDHDNDPIQLEVTQQLGMGDRYTGKEYVTAQNLESLVLDGNTINLKAKYPGNYRLIITASDKDGTTQRSIDVPVRLLSLPIYQIRGMTLGGTQWPLSALSKVDYTLDRMISAGVNCMALVTNWYVDDYTDYTIEPWYRDRPGFPTNQTWFYPTLYDDDVKEIIQEAHERGMCVILKPHADVLDQPFGGRGRWGLEPSGDNWNGLFESYTNFILHYARIAEEENVEILVIGTEMNSMTDPNYLGVDNPDQRWRNLITSVREVYHGKLTYSTAFHGSFDDTYSAPNNISFWDALDLIGFEIYKGLTRDNMDPTVEELQNAFEHILRNYVIPLSQRYDRQVLIPEMNFHSFDGVNTTPIGSRPHSEIRDWEEQARLYAAVLQSLSDEGRWFKGIVWWAGYTLGPNDNLDWLRRDNSDWIWTKPAESVIQYNWTVD